MWEKEACPFGFEGKSTETEATIWSELSNEARSAFQQILGSEDRNRSKKKGLWESNSEIWVGELFILVRSIQIEKLDITEFTEGL